jgi:CHASE3 domain sensor protein
MLIDMLDQETGLRGYINTQSDAFLEPYRTGRRHLEVAIGEMRRYATDRDDPPFVNRQLTIARRWQALAEEELRQLQAGGHSTVTSAVSRKALMDSFRVANARFTKEKLADPRSGPCALCGQERGA